MKWFSFYGVALTGIGVIVGLFWPTIGAEWAGEDTANDEWWLSFRYGVGIVCVILGTALQMHSAWPR